MGASWDEVQEGMEIPTLDEELQHAAASLLGRGLGATSTRFTTTTTSRGPRVSKTSSCTAP